MFNIKNAITLLFPIILYNPVVNSTISFCPSIPSENYIYQSDLKNLPSTYKYKDQEIETKKMHMGISVESVSRSVHNNLAISTIPEIHTIDAEQLIRGKFSEKQQKECLKSLDKFSAKAIIREQDIDESEIMSEKELKKKVFDSDIILTNVYSGDNIVQVLTDPIVQARFARLEKYFKYKRAKAFKQSKIDKYNSILRIITAVRSGKMQQLIDKIQHSDLATAYTTFNELKKLFSWKGGYICHNAYPLNLLGIDILRIVADDFITRADFIINNFGVESLNEIEQFLQVCNTLQQKNDMAALEYIHDKLATKVTMNRTRNMIDEICYAIAERTFRDPINIKLGQIRYASWNDACAILQSLEGQELTEQSMKIISNKEYLQKSILYRSKINQLALAQKFHKNRSDYALLSNSEIPINEGSNVAKSQNVPEIEFVEISQPIEQQIFVPVDVQYKTADILYNNNNYHAVANGLKDIAKQVFENAYLGKLEHIADIQKSIDQSLNIIQSPKNEVEFIFHVATVDHVLNDLQTQAEIIHEGKPTLWEKTPDLLVRAATTFILRLNPVEQVKDLGSLAQSGISILKDGILALSDAALHPLTTAEQIYYGAEKVCEFIINTARFTSDSINGVYYLTPEERTQRITDYWQNVQIFYQAIEPHLTAENIVDITATLAADMVAGKGFCCVYQYAKDVHVLSKVNQHARKIAKTFKCALDNHLADNPMVITAEGIVLKMSNGMKDFNKGPREIINSSKNLLESIYAPIADALKVEIVAMRKKYDRIKEGFAQITNKITMEYQHILGMELDLSKKGKLTVGGFHHDLKNTIEKTDILRFTNRISYEHGFYKATLFDGENFVKNVTFFPAEWSRDIVISKIYEAYDNFLKGGAIGYIEQGNKYVIRGKIKEGIEIEMYITKNGNIVTAYPILERF